MLLQYCGLFEACRTYFRVILEYCGLLAVLVSRDIKIVMYCRFGALWAFVGVGFVGMWGRLAWK